MYGFTFVKKRLFVTLQRFCKNNSAKKNFVMTQKNVAEIQFDLNFD